MANYFPLFVAHDAAPARRSREIRRSVFHRFLAAVTEWRRRGAERDIARCIEGSGFTDSVERQIDRRFLSNRWDRM